MPTLDVIQESLQRYARPDKHRRSAESLGVAVDDWSICSHGAMIAPSPPDGSELGRFAAFQFRERFIGKGVEPGFGDVVLDLLVPHLPVALQKPRAELGDLRDANLLDLVQALRPWS